jgi:hypothetical protein
MRLLLVVSLLLLGGCNMLITKQPLYALSDAAATPQLREGVWRAKSDGKCVFTEARPVSRWPSCANGFVALHGMVRAYDHSKGKRTPTTSAFFLVGATPSVLQLPAEDKGPKGAADDPAYFYMGVRPTRTDDQGRVTAFAAWPALCGPPPPSDAKGADGKTARYGSLEPLSGLSMDKDDNDCTTASQDAIHAAVIASEAWTKPDALLTAHWVRDGDR